MVFKRDMKYFWASINVLLHSYMLPNEVPFLSTTAYVSYLLNLLDLAGSQNGQSGFIKRISGQTTVV
jgi:hypothetical protein